MSISKALLYTAVVIAFIVGGSLPAQADANLGKFAWALAPGCEEVILQVSEASGIFALHGFAVVSGSSICTQSGESRRVPVQGAAFLTGDGTAIIMGFTMLFPGNAIHVNARLDPATITGSWLDDKGSGGTLMFRGSRP